MKWPQSRLSYCDASNGVVHQYDISFTRAILDPGTIWAAVATQAFPKGSPASCMIPEGVAPSYFYAGFCPAVHWGQCACEALGFHLLRERTGMDLHLVSSSWRVATNGPIQPQQPSVLRLPPARRLATPAMSTEPRTKWPFKGLWRNGSASDSRSEGWEFEFLWPQFLCPKTMHSSQPAQMANFHAFGAGGQMRTRGRSAAGHVGR